VVGVRSRRRIPSAQPSENVRQPGFRILGVKVLTAMALARVP
jgi:hypothetical protein